MREEILKILAKYSILEESVGDLIIKDKIVFFSIDIGLLQLNKNEAEKIAKICENEIKRKLNLKKINIVLTQNKNTAKPNNNKDFQGNHTNNFISKKNLLGQEILPIKGTKKVIAIASAKGGVGKSTIAANIAVLLQHIGYKIALVDADIYGPSIAYLMNLQGKPQNKEGLLLPIISHNIKCISLASLIDEKAAGIWRGPMITKILYQLIRSIDWNYDNQDVDFMIIDMPPGTGDVYLSMAEKFPVDGAVIVSTPQSLAVIDVVRSIDCFRKLQIPILGLIQNMSYLENHGVKQYLFGKDGAKNLAQKENIKFLGEVPIAQELSEASEAKAPLAASKPGSEAALMLGRIAEEIVDLLK